MTAGSKMEQRPRQSAVESGDEADRKKTGTSGKPPIGTVLAPTDFSPESLRALEAIIAQVVHPDLGAAYLGTQGDIWDTQKDMVAAIPATLAVTSIGRRRLRSE